MSRVISVCFWTISGHECSFVKESSKVFPRNTDTYFFCAPVNRKRLLNIWNLLMFGEDKNIAVARFDYKQCMTESSFTVYCFSLDQERNIPQEMAKFTFE